MRFGKLLISPSEPKMASVVCGGFDFLVGPWCGSDVGSEVSMMSRLSLGEELPECLQEMSLPSTHVHQHYCNIPYLEVKS